MGAVLFAYVRIILQFIGIVYGKAMNSCGIYARCNVMMVVVYHSLR